MPHQPRVHGKIIAKFPELDYRNPGLFHPVAARFTLSACVTVWLFMTGLHFIQWLTQLRRTGSDWSAILQNWDAGWYLKIVTSGYDAASAAFPPLFPYTLRSLAGLLQLESSAAILWLGTIFSSLCFALTLFVLFASYKRQLSLGSLLIFLLSPAAYIFHSFHTESLFLLLSVLAFAALGKKRWWLAAIWAGLAALVRHQGVFLAIALAFGGMMNARGWPKKLLIFAAMGLISGLLWGAGPLLHFSEGRGWFPAVSAHQSHWFIADGISSYFKTFILANPIQNLRWGSLIHHLFYFLWVAGAFLVLRKGYFAEALYCFLSLAVMPLQGELVDAFRFGAVLFPLLFALGKVWERWPAWFAWPVMGLYVSLNLVVTWQYGIARWAY